MAGSGAASGAYETASVPATVRTTTTRRQDDPTNHRGNPPESGKWPATVQSRANADGDGRTQPGPDREMKISTGIFSSLARGWSVFRMISPSIVPLRRAGRHGDRHPVSAFHARRIVLRDGHLQLLRRRGDLEMRLLRPRGPSASRHVMPPPGCDIADSATPGEYADRADHLAPDRDLELGPLRVVGLDHQFLVELAHRHARLDLHIDGITRLDLELLGLLRPSSAWPRRRSAPGFELITFVTFVSGRSSSRPRGGHVAAPRWRSSGTGSSPGERPRPADRPSP